MAFVTWTTKMSVGIARLDKQHQGLFDIINQLHAGMMQRRGNDVLGSSITNLAQYTKIHFSEEEALLRAQGYPQLEEHLKLHQSFRDKVAEMDANFKAGKVALAIPALEFLSEWLSKHILVVDMQYRDFLASKGIR